MMPRVFADSSGSQLVDRNRDPASSGIAARVADRHARADVLLDAVLRERIAQPVFSERLHAGDCFVEIFGGEGHQHFVVEHAAIAALGKARDRQARAPAS